MAVAGVSIIEEGEDAIHLALSGRLDVLGVEAVSIRLAALTNSSRKALIVDLSEVSYIASIGIGMLIREAKAVAAQWSRMALVRPTEMVDKILRMAMLDTVIPIAQSANEARLLLRAS